MNFTRNQIIIIGIAGSAVLFFVLILLGVLPGLRQSGTGGGLYGGKQTEIVFWGIEDETIMRQTIDAYSQINPSVRITYAQFPENSFEDSLVDALASGQGPDIFMFRNSWLPKHYNKIFPAAETQISLARFRQLFPQVAEQDFTSAARIYALPLYVDTLALIYNKDYFDVKGAAVAPKTWDEFKYLIPRLREIGSGGKIAKAALAIGGSEKSVDKAGDLLSLLMFQFGAEMIDKNGQANFSRTGGLEALNFYLQFGNPSSVYYTWNDNLRPSLDNFSQETTAAILNYASAIPVIKSKNPFLNLAVAPMLQFNKEKPVNYADYWGLAVSNQSKNAALAWDFIISVAANNQIAEQYLLASKRPPALRDLFKKYQNDPDLGVFVNQTLTAKSWFQPDNNAVKQIFSNMVESVLNGRLSPEKALEQAENEINNL